MFPLVMLEWLKKIFSNDLGLVSHVFEYMLFILGKVLKYLGILFEYKIRKVLEYLSLVLRDRIKKCSST